MQCTRRKWQLGGLIVLFGLTTSPLYAIDTDSDGIVDSHDTCLLVPNQTKQEDSDLDGIGNLCDPDYTNDGAVGAPDFNRLVNSFLSSIGDSNYDRAVDANTDGAIGAPDFTVLVNYFLGAPGPSGLACADPTIKVINGDTPCLPPPDGDTDGDGILDSSDNCMTVPNISQADADGDFVGDFCDACPIIYGVDHDLLVGEALGERCPNALAAVTVTNSITVLCNESSSPPFDVVTPLDTNDVMLLDYSPDPAFENETLLIDPFTEDIAVSWDIFPCQFSMVIDPTTVEQNTFVSFFLCGATGPDECILTID